MHPMSLKRKDFLLREGEICQYEAYIIKGCLRKYCIDDAGNEINLQFGIEDWWMSDLASFTEQKPSQLNIQALEDSELLVIRHAEKERLFAEVPATERLFRLMVQRSLNALRKGSLCGGLDGRAALPVLFGALPSFFATNTAAPYCFISWNDSGVSE
jgi:CRP/FNR family cyclic AMP-dependent transcriptional regulator